MGEIATTCKHSFDNFLSCTFTILTKEVLDRYRCHLKWLNRSLFRHHGYRAQRPSADPSQKSVSNYRYCCRLFSLRMHVTRLTLAISNSDSLASYLLPVLPRWMGAYLKQKRWGSPYQFLLLPVMSSLHAPCFGSDWPSSHSFLSNPTKGLPQSLREEVT